MPGIKIIHGDNFESSGGAQYVAKDNAVQFNTVQQAPVSEMLALLEKVRQSLPNLPVPQEVKEDVEHEVQGALRQAQREDRGLPPGSSGSLGGKLEDRKGGGCRGQHAGTGLDLVRRAVDELGWMKQARA